MSKIIIKRLYINPQLTINFNEGQNYIIGLNGSGKTTLFNLIQYLLGLKGNFTRLINYWSFDSPYLECKFKDKSVRISRKLPSNMIFFEGDIHRQAKANSIELNQIYTELMNIKFVSPFNELATLDILGHSFYAELDIKGNSKEKQDTYHKIVGYNSEYLDSIEKDIKTIENEVAFDNHGLKLVEKYKNGVENSIAKIIEDNTLNKLNDIIGFEYKKIKEKIIENYNLMERARTILIQEKEFSEEFINEQLSIIDAFFYHTINHLTKRNENFYNFKDVMKQRNFNVFSYGQKNIILFVLRLTFCRDLKDLKYNNGAGILVTDDLLSVNDADSSTGVTEKITEVVNEGALQYISFSRYNSYIPKEHVVFEMPGIQGGGIFER
ncbi:hypothetical protein SAMN04487895_10958 [Paenibacillus sophorae]|uniref:ATP-binding protein n=1 Tax=Paenibacillus sophorae TaxID=1333845 RepID=A0A1H8QXY1_9BACL|nr:ATP-binding protein [Paenibacillus sophorae]QWU14883.1 ATP-binding protein [Paenibacillus sophorae]SEO59200.1 hypothetical protein SAMN04487895_10958 [Paenibacillus sophorae]